jgi:hypothetical protein
MTNIDGSFQIDGLIDGDQLSAPTTTKRGGVKATGTPSGKFYKDDDTWADPDTSSDITTTLVHAAASKNPPVDADEVPLLDSIATFGLKKLTWETIKATLKSYFDAIYAATAKGVTNGDSHDHVGGDGNQIHHGGASGLTDDDHTQYVLHSLATAEHDFLLGAASPFGSWVKHTLAEVKTALGLGTAAYTAATDYVGADGARMPAPTITAKGGVPAILETPAAKFLDDQGNWSIPAGAEGVTDHGALTGLTDDDHTQYIKHSLAANANDMLMASGAGTFVKKTIAEVKTALGLGTAAYTAAGDYAVTAKGVTGGDSHNALHTAFIPHSLATAINDFLVASGSGTYVKKTLAEVKTILGLGSAAYTASSDYATVTHNQAASTINSGTLAAAQLPSATTSAKGAMPILSDVATQYLNGDGAWSAVAYSGLSGIPSTFAPSAHNQAASTITSGTFDAARIPSLAASIITSGTFDGNRLPVMSSAKLGGVPATGTPSGKLLNDYGSWVASTTVLPFKTVGFTAGMDYVCDGTNDEVQIQAAHDALPANGGRIILGPGTYSATGVVFTKTTILEGAGRLATHINCNSGIGFHVNGAHRSVIRDLSIHSTSGPSGNIGIKVSNTYQTVVNNIYLQGLYTGIWIYAGASNQISNFGIDDCVQHGILMDGNGTEVFIGTGTITGFSTHTAYGILNQGYCGNLISHVDVIMCTIANAIYATTTDCTWNYFNNCMFDTSQGTGWGTFLAGAGSIYVRGTFFTQTWLGTNQIGVVIGSNVEGVTFHDSQIVNSANNGININGTGTVQVIFDGGIIAGNGNGTTTQAQIDSASYVEFNNLFFGAISGFPGNPQRHIYFTGGNVADGWVHNCHFGAGASIASVTDNTSGHVAYTGNDPTVP